MTSLPSILARFKPILQRRAATATSRSPAFPTRAPPSRSCTYMITRPAPSPSVEPDINIKRRRLSTLIAQPRMERRARPVNDSANRANITLNAVELRLRNLLIDVASFIKENSVSAKEEGTPVPSDIASEPLTLRFTGGWVRDKLLGVESHDIDVALSNMTGYQFGLRLKEYLEDDDHVKKHGLQDDPKKVGLAKIAANPEKSKHLETVTTKIMGLDIDLVNLRKEVYTEDSRNPAMEFGTPREDADRRDATINAMFYNLNDSVVEDLTGMGLDDLDKGIIRTPLSPPLETFRDDPLRVLRLIRFASRFGYIIEDEALQAMRKAEIKSALVHKITKERIWVELEKMLRGPDPRSALSYIDNLGLYTTIFCDVVTKGQSDWQPQTSNWAKTCDTLERLLSKNFAEKSEVVSIAVTDADADSLFMAWMLSGFIPWTDAPELPAQKTGKPSPPLASLVAREGLKAPNKVSDLLTLCVKHIKEISDWSMATPASVPRDKLGMAIKNWGPTWKMQLLYTMLYQINEEPDDEERIIARFDKLVDKIRELDLLEAHDLRPLLDGKQLSAALKITPGPWMKAALDVVLAWQLRNPSITDTSEALKEVEASGVLTARHNSPEPEKKGKGQKNKQAAKGELTSALTTHFLRETLRPLFSQAKNPELTSAGRRRMDNSTSRKTADLDDRDQPWKQQKTLVFGLLGWICRQHLNYETTTAEWGYLIPPLLTLVDETDVVYRAEGAKLLGMLLQNSPPACALLNRTGLAPVFEQSLMTNLSFLPSLTPETDTILIYNATIPTLITLANCYGTTFTNKARPSSKEPKKIELFDRVMRKGLLHAYKFCGENVRISEMVVLTHLPLLLDAYESIEPVKFLKDLLPMLSNILADPFGTAYPPLLEKAAEVLERTIWTTWPRAFFWRTEILRGVTICWLRIAEDEVAEDEADSLKLNDVKAGLIDVVGVLTVACAKTGHLSDLREDVKLLVMADNRLTSLFAVTLAED